MGEWATERRIMVPIITAMLFDDDEIVEYVPTEGFSVFLRKCYEPSILVSIIGAVLWVTENRGSI